MTIPACRLGSGFACLDERRLQHRVALLSGVRPLLTRRHLRQRRQELYPTSGSRSRRFRRRCLVQVLCRISLVDNPSNYSLILFDDFTCAFLKHCRLTEGVVYEASKEKEALGKKLLTYAKCPVVKST